MIHILRYGDRDVSVELPDDGVDMIVAKATPYRDESDIIQDAIAAARPSLREFLGSSDSVLLVVSDHTRNTGSRIYVPILLDMMRRPGRKITILVALGLHRPSTESEIADILGCAPGDGITVKNHDPDANLAECGEEFFCRDAVDAEKIVVTGSVAFHPMAGFSGGWKSILPGIASRESVIENHRLYFSGAAMDPRVGPARVEDNPIQTDIRRRTAGFAGKTWCLEVVQNEMKSIVFASAGQVDDAWTACAGFLERSNSPAIARLYPVVVASAGGYPSDFSFYQSMKTLTNASRACEKGGSIYLVMECRNGWELNEEILAWGHLGLEEIAMRLRKDFSMSGLAMYMALSVIREHRVLCMSSLPEREVAGLGMRHVATEAELGDLVRAEIANRIANRIAVIPAAAAVLPSSGPGKSKGDTYAP